MGFFFLNYAFVNSVILISEVLCWRHFNVVCGQVTCAGGREHSCALGVFALVYLAVQRQQISLIRSTGAEC